MDSIKKVEQITLKSILNSSRMKIVFSMMGDEDVLEFFPETSRRKTKVEHNPNV